MITNLKVSDRCDGCGAQAFVAVNLEHGTVLLFCGHHYGKHESALPSTATVFDARDSIPA